MRDNGKRNVKNYPAQNCESVQKGGSWEFFSRGFAENFKCFRFIPPKVTKSLGRRMNTGLRQVTSIWERSLRGHLIPHFQARSYRSTEVLALRRCSGTSWSHASLRIEDLTWDLNCENSNSRCWHLKFLKSNMSFSTEKIWSYHIIFVILHLLPEGILVLRKVLINIYDYCLN
jgi:hypothetical protein